MHSDGRSSPPRTALVVDDDVRDRRRIVRILEREGFAVDEAIDGRGALDRLRRKIPYDLVVLDIFMPHVDGFDVMHFLETYDRETLAKTIVMSQGSVEDMKRFFPSCRRLPKPVDEGEFLLQVREVLAESSRKEREGSGRFLRRQAEELPPSGGLRILVADRDEDYARFLSSLTRRLGGEPTELREGSRICEALASDEFDVAFVSLEIPELDRLEVAERLRIPGRRTHAVMLMEGSDRETKMQALQAGFDDSLPRAASSIEVIAKLVAARRALSRQRMPHRMLNDVWNHGVRDEVSGLFSRRYFTEEAEFLLAHDENVSLVLFSLDDLESVTSRFGREAADRVLRDVGRLLRDTTRYEDTVGRVAGNQLGMLIPGLDPQDGEAVAVRIAGAIEDLSWVFEGETAGLSVSIGFATSAYLDTTDVADLMTACESYLYTKRWLAEHPEPPGAVPAESEGGGAGDLRFMAANGQ
jgi:diguanylate cyclase (GGDEF)-like protein